jgi:superfamily II DNA or RNA helicase
MQLALREYQVEALQRVAAAEARGVRRQLGVAATGLGKTVMFCALAESRGKRTLILAHRDELVSQAEAKVREVWPDAPVGVVKAERNEVRAHVVVASVQTLARPRRLAQLCAAWDDPSILLKPAEPFDLVVVDEAHHTAADSYRGILDALRAGQPGCRCGEDHERLATPDEVDAGYELGVAYDPCPRTDPGPLLLGVTATPDRGDGKGLDDLYDEITFNFDLLWGIRAGYLADLRGRRVTMDHLDLSGVAVRRGDFDQGQAGKAMEAADAPRQIVAAWQAEAADRRTLVFTPTVELARLVAEAYRHAGVAADYVHGGTPLDDRRRLLADYQAGTLQVLANCAVLTEGFDAPRTDCVVVARPTRSRALYVQMVGRGTRPHPDKADCLVLDVVGATATHSLVTVPSLFGLEGAYAGRMGDGTAGLAGVVQERDDELVRLGRMRAEDADLFRRLREGAGIAWVAVHRDGDQLRRYERALGADLPTVVLAQRPGGDVWTAGLWWPAGRDTPERKAVLMANVTLELAQGVADDYVRKNGIAALASADAAWRKRKPTDAALAAAGRWRLKDPKQYATAGELSDALNAHISRIKAKPRRRAKAPA